MRTACQAALLLTFALQLTNARLLQSLPEDTYAFPKYRVTYLNGLPLLKDTAERWLRDGLRGGESEFLDQPWKDAFSEASPSRKSIESSDSQVADQLDSVKSSNLTLEHMKMGPDSSYLCLIPPPIDSPTSSSPEEQEDVTPIQSWSLLQPLSGKCLYHRQPWFTYSYCHNQEIRQFRELPHSHPIPPGGYEPTEDPDWESYTLGRAPPVPEPGVDLTVAQESALAANLELARGAGSRYLVQRWGDGTLCDKSGKPREVEVQFHCSMTMTDTVALIREAKTCSYVMVIHTPRLCGEPGFKSRLEARDESYIRCREIVDSADPSNQAEDPLKEFDSPRNKMPPRNPLLSVPAKSKPAEPKADSGKGKVQGYQERLRKSLEAVLGKQGDGELPQVVVEEIHLGEDGDEDVVFQIDLDDMLFGDDHDETGGAVPHQSILEALKAAGYDVKGEKESETKDKKKRKPQEEAPLPERDEL